MRGSAMLKTYEYGEAHSEDAGKADAFAIALTELGREYGIGITGGMLFVLEADDRAHGYSVDADSRLTLG